jgi:Alpha/beta hydrolase of unknown function (DUF900)
MTEASDTERGRLASGIPLLIVDRCRPLDTEDEFPIPGYIAISTATNNVEDDERESLIANIASRVVSSEIGIADWAERTESYLQEIARILSDDKVADPEIVIAVHGFNNNFNGAQSWYKDIHKYICSDSSLRSKNLVFIGYRWPAENFLDRLTMNISSACRALPILPRNIFSACLLISLLLLVTLLITYSKGLLLLFGLTTVIASLILMLIILRLVVYFRDAYRSAYFGTPDLVELIRQIDRAIYQHNSNRKVKLSFLGHSLGCSVIINAIRILSDVFDPSSIGTLDSYQPEKLPSNAIGRIFQLERLVLVAPDIPVESVIPRRSNFLRSAIRRVREAHVFTNEGDLALRLGSTAANYFSFPAKTRFSGYRLGNLTAKHFEDFQDKTGSAPQYGIINPQMPGLSKDLPFKHLEIRSSRREHRKLQEEPFYPWVATNPDDVTNRLSYYDCTDYSDCTDSTTDVKGVVSLAVGKPSLCLPDYAKLLFAYILNTLKDKAGVDTHGGYFHGKLSKYLIYHLAFAGFDELNTSLQPQQLGDLCKEQRIQVILSSE